MGWFDRFRRSKAPDRFARMVLDRLSRAGETREVRYDPATFCLLTAEASIYLGNVFAEWQRSDPEARERLLRLFQTTWFTTGMPLPEEFADARPDVLAAVRSRAYYEVGLPLMAATTTPEGNALRLSYVEVGGVLGASPIYDLPTSIRQISDESLGQWGVTLYEALEVAKQNLAETTREVAKVGDIYCFSSGDCHDAARILLTDLIARLEVDGDHVAMAPNRELLIVTGSESESGLLQMATLAERALRHERAISGVALRLEGESWTPWLPSARGDARARLRTLKALSEACEHGDQQALFQARRGRVDGVAEAAEVAPYELEGAPDNGGVWSRCDWREGEARLLPRADRVAFWAAGPKGRPHRLAGSAPWGVVQQELAGLMTPLDLYPPRWRVEAFPTPAELSRVTALG